MKTEIITSIQKNLQALRELVSQSDLSSLDLKDLEKYSEEELLAINVFLEKSIVSLGNYYSEYGKLVSGLNEEYEKGADEILEGEGGAEDQQKVAALQKVLKGKR